VILLKNLDVEAGLVNGSRGTVIAFVDAAKEEGDDEDEKGGSAASVSSEKLPMIEFLNANDGTILTKQIGREDFTIEQGGREVAKRSQLPLKLAWAISIHKSQGMTIDCLEVDLRGCFEFGQAYVALSRATSLQQLRVLNFEPQQVKAHPKVVEFYRSLHAL
jgi:ATP-dependent DNA helicase PIF1